MFSFFFGGKAGDFIAPRPLPNKEIWSLLKAGLLEKALIALRNPKSAIDVNEVDESTGMTLLHMTCAQGAMELVVELLSQGADIAAYSTDGNNCLHYAAINDRKGIVEILLRSGADPSIPNAAGILPVELAKTIPVRELFLRDRSAIFSPIVQTRMLLSDYIEQLSLSDSKPAAVPKVTSQITADIATITHSSLPVVCEGSEDTEENVSRKTVFNMADELDEVETSPARQSDLMLNIPQEDANDTCIVGVATPAFARQHSSLDNPSRGESNAPAGDYTLVGVSSVRKSSKKILNAEIEDYSSSESSADIDSRAKLLVHKAHGHLHEEQRLFYDGSGGFSPSTTPNKASSSSSRAVPKLNLGGIGLAPPPTDTDYNANLGYISGGSNPLNSARSGMNTATGTGSRNNSLTPTTTTVGAMMTPRTERDRPGLASISQDAITPNGYPSAPDAFEIEQLLHDDSELRQAVLQAAAQTAQAMQGNRDDFEARRLMVRCCQKFNEANARKWLTFDPRLAMARATEMGALAVDGQTILHVAASFGNVELLKLMVEMGQDVSLWVRDLQGRTPLHVAAEKGHESTCEYLREAMCKEKQRDPVGDNAPTDLAGTTPLGWATIGAKGKPKKGGMIKALFSPGDRSILPRTPVSTRAGKSPWKAPPTAGYDKVVRENIVFAFSEAHGWTPGMEDRILVSCPVIGRPAWSLFGVCDGHGGSFCSEYLATALPAMLAKEAAVMARYTGSTFKAGGNVNDFETTPHQLKELLSKICVDADTQLSEHPRMIVEHSGTTRLKYTCMDGSGSTAILALITAQYVAVANVGDSRAVLAVRPAAAVSAALNALQHPFPSTPRGGAGGAAGSTEALDGLAVSGSSPDVHSVGADGGVGFSHTSGGPESFLDAVGLSRDHKVSIPEERARAEAAGATIEEVGTAAEGREAVYQMFTPACEVKLRMTRSFGDFYLKQNKELPYEEQAIIAVPEVLVYTRTARDAFLVLACDGIWDVMTNQQVVDFMSDKLGYTAYGGPVGGVTTQSVASACDLLLQQCLERGTVDNISVILIVLGAPHTAVVHQAAVSRASPVATPSGGLHDSLASAVLTTPSRSNARRPSYTASSHPPRMSTARKEESDIDLPIFDMNKPSTGSLHEVFQAVEDSSSSGGCDSPLNTAAGAGRVRKQLSFTNP